VVDLGVDWFVCHWQKGLGMIREEASGCWRGLRDRISSPNFGSKRGRSVHGTRSIWAALLGRISCPCKNI
jgi:hypothetical protein